MSSLTLQLIWIQLKNEEFFHEFMSKVKDGIIGTCAYALQECARPEVKQAMVTAPNPFSGLIVWICLGADSCALPTVFGATCPVDVVWIWTIPTPSARNSNESHLTGLSFLRKSTTENAAVVRIFI